MRRPGQTLSREQLLEQVWGEDGDAESNVVDVYVYYLRQKVDRPFGAREHRDGARRRIQAAPGRVIVGRLSIRARLAAGFAAGLLLVLAGAGAFVYLSVQDDLNSSLDDALRSRADDVAALVGPPGERPQQLGGGPIARAEDKEGFSQIVTPRGRIVATTLAPGTGPALDQGEIDRAAGESLFTEHAVPGVEGEVRILGRPGELRGPDVRRRRRQLHGRPQRDARRARTRLPDRRAAGDRRCLRARLPARRPVTGAGRGDEAPSEGDHRWSEAASGSLSPRRG